jgi:hypothetical protein
MSEIVYSAQKHSFVKGRIYQNPRFFNGVLHPGATSVIIVGDWPVVKNVYEAAGIPVRVTKDPNKLPTPDEGGPDNVSKQVTTEHKDSVVKGKGKEVGDIDPPLKEGQNVEIPEDFEDLSFRDLKTLAAKIADSTVPDFSSKREAVEFLTEYKAGKRA